MIACLALIPLLLALSGCASVPVVPIQDLLDDPKRYAGQEIRVCGWFVMRMEECSLAPDRNHQATSIWVAPRTDACVPIRWFENPRAEWATVSGIVRTGGGWGHLGMYETVLAAGTIKRVRECPAEGGT
jgi:hypothetical protein